MRIAYLDCISGVSGDMTLAALVDAGVELAALQQAVGSLGLPDVSLRIEEVKRRGFRALKAHVDHPPEHAHRHLHHIVAMIEGSSLSATQQELAVRIFTRLGEAEAKVHGTTIQKVHFHEVGAVDSIVDIVGAAVGWDLLGVDRIVCSPIPTGRGEIEIAHGRVSVPAPATAELLKGVPLAASDIEAELTTPTGAAIVAALVDQFGALPAMRIEQIGYGAGSKELKEQANVLRLLVGAATDTIGADQACLLETNLDDATGEMIGHCATLMLEAGALDVYTTAIQMKKNRPAVQISVLCRPEQADEMERLLFRETGTLGVRRSLVGRRVLERKPLTVSTPLGDIAGKLASPPGGETWFAPEYESCKAAAARHNVSLREAFAAAQIAFEKHKQTGR